MLGRERTRFGGGGGVGGKVGGYGGLEKMDL